MNHHKAKLFWITTLIVAVFSFVFLWLGVKFIIGQTVSTQNLLAYALLSLVFGGLSGAFFALDMKATFTIFVAGLLIGYFLMFWQFIAGLDGWVDLTGLLYLFMCAGIGLAAGLLVQLIWYLIRRTRRRRR